MCEANARAYYLTVQHRLVESALEHFRRRNLANNAAGRSSLSSEIVIHHPSLFAGVIVSNVVGETFSV